MVRKCPVVQARLLWAPPGQWLLLENVCSCSSCTLFILELLNLNWEKWPFTPKDQILGSLGASSPAGIALHGVTVMWGREESPSCNSGLEILCCPCDPLPVQHRWGCLVVIDYLLFWFFPLKILQISLLQEWGSLMPSEWLHFPEHKKENSWCAQVSGFSWEKPAGLGHVAIFSWYKGREAIKDQGEKPKQAKFPKPGFHEPPQEWGLFSVWFPTRQ